MYRLTVLYFVILDFTTNSHRKINKTNLKEYLGVGNLYSLVTDTKRSVLVIFHI